MLNLNPRNQITFYSPALLTLVKHSIVSSEENCFKKLKLVGVTGHFLEIVHSMYSNDKSSVKIENMLTPAFRCHTGVKQGCMLSPTLFNLYLSDLSEELKAKNLNDVELNELPLSCMLYADDLVIFSK